MPRENGKLDMKPNYFSNGTDFENKEKKKRERETEPIQQWGIDFKNHCLTMVIFCDFQITDALDMGQDF